VGLFCSSVLDFWVAALLLFVLAAACRLGRERRLLGKAGPQGRLRLQGLAPGGVAEAGHGALLAGGASAGAHGCRRRSTRGIDRGGWGARAVQLVAHRSKRGSRRQRRGLGDGGVGLGARLPGLVRRRSWGRCVAREEVTGACRRPQGRR
jgi:hypothetical protein